MSAPDAANATDELMHTAGEGGGGLIGFFVRAVGGLDLLAHQANFDGAEHKRANKVGTGFSDASGNDVATGVLMLFVCVVESYRTCRVVKAEGVAVRVGIGGQQ